MPTHALRSPEWSHSQPRSSGYPSRSYVNARPPSWDGASNNSTAFPYAASRRAAPLPAAPPYDDDVKLAGHVAVGQASHWVRQAMRLAVGRIVQDYWVLPGLTG